MKTTTKLALILYFTLCFTLLLPGQALAYIDPSTTTFLVQAIVGVGVAIVAAVAVYWRKAKKKVADKLGIDENAHKEVESDEISFTENAAENADTANATAATNAATANATEQPKQDAPSES